MDIWYVITQMEQGMLGNYGIRRIIKVIPTTMEDLDQAYAEFNKMINMGINVSAMIFSRNADLSFLQKEADQAPAERQTDGTN